MEDSFNVIEGYLDTMSKVWPYGWYFAVIILVLLIRLNFSSNPEEILWTNKERLPQHYEQSKAGG